MTPRSLVFFGSLFVASFLVTWQSAGPGSAQLVRTARTLIPARGPTLAAPGPSSAGDPGSSVRPEAVGAAEPVDTPVDFAAAVRDATAAGSSDERIRAVQLLSTAPGRQGLDVLMAVSSQSPDPVERAAAITALRQRRPASGQGDRISDAFRQAAMDTDPLVAVLAQSAQEDMQP